MLREAKHAAFLATRCDRIVLLRGGTASEGASVFLARGVPTNRGCFLAHAQVPWRFTNLFGLAFPWLGQRVNATTETSKKVGQFSRLESRADLLRVRTLPWAFSGDAF
jgi:hypothetical protein